MRQMMIFAFAGLALFVACGGEVVPEDTGVDTIVTDGIEPIDTMTGDTMPDTGRDTVEPPDVAVDADDPDSVTPDNGGQDVSGPCVTGEPCDDGNSCTWGEMCSDAGVCAGGEAYTCDDERTCTDDMCDGLGNCRFTMKADKCLINGICRDTGAADPDDPCSVCTPATSQSDWSVAVNETECDPSSTLGKCEDAPGGKCQDGTCIPTTIVPKGCDDGDPCSEDSCDTATGCVHVSVSTGECVLEDKCMPGYCFQGECIIPEDASCDDHNGCTADLCDEAKGCVHTLISEAICDDGDECTYEDACSDGVCEGLPTNCDDGNVCTADGCDSITGCYHDLATNPCCIGGVSICDDDNPCTNDDCDPETFECLYGNNTAACSDGNPCTAGDSCDEGDCFGLSKNCSDGNDCTADYCEGGLCFHDNLDGDVCSDGLDCSTGDRCVAGACLPLDESGCVCQPTFYPAVSKLVTMAISANGKTGSGLDLDGNPATCAPAEDCCCGIQNALGPVAGLPVAQDGIKDAMEGGDITLLFEHRDIKTDGTPYTLAFYSGKLAASNATCNFLTQDCDYTVEPMMITDECNPLVTLDNAKIVGNKLTAGGMDYIFPFDLPLMEGINLHVDLYFTRLEASVTVSGGRVTSMQGILGGAVPKQQLSDAVAAIPDETWVGLPIDKATVQTLLELLVVPDIDGDGDGTPESASIGIQFTAIPGEIVGRTPED